MGERESDIPQAEQFSSSNEEREFHLATEFDPHVRQAEEIMEAAAESSTMDHLLDELSTELKREQPDQEKLADVRRRIADEAALQDADRVAVDFENIEPAITHMRDVNETLELRDHDFYSQEISRLVAVNEDLKGRYSGDGG